MTSTIILLVHNEYLRIFTPARAPQKPSSQGLEYEGISMLITACLSNLLEKRRRQPVSISKCMAVYYHDVIKKMAFFHHMAQMERSQGRAADAQVTVSPSSAQQK